MIKLKSFIISLLRRGTYRWPPRSEALKRAKISRGIYECNICKGHYRHKDVAIDHVVPVVGVEGFTTWDDYINRMYPEDPNKFQVLCSMCHDIKTKKENLERQKARQEKKKLDIKQ